MLHLIERPDDHVLVRVAPARRAIVSWNSRSPAGALALTMYRTDGSISEPLPYVRWLPTARRSLDGADDRTRIAVDIVRSEVPLSGIGIATEGSLEAVAVATPPLHDDVAAYRYRVATLDVPTLPQAVTGVPHSGSRWCSPASLAMLLRYHGVDVNVRETAAGVTDERYGGTGNWAFNAAYAGRFGLRGVVAYLAGLDHAGAFLAAGLPVALSIAWNHGELVGAPLPTSDGHLIVLRGLEPGFAIVNDPAQPGVAVRYDRASLDRVFRAHGGVAYLVAPRARSGELVALANDIGRASARRATE
jgi:hypothetical protein